MAERYDPKKDPIVGAGPGAGTHRTKSGRLVNSNGVYLTKAETKGWNNVDPHDTIIRSSPPNVEKAVKGIRLPGVPHVFTNRASLLKFLKASPGYVKKQRGWLNAHHQDALHEAGWAVGKGAKLVKLAKPVKPAAKPAAKAATPAASAAPMAVEEQGLGGFEMPTVDFSGIEKLNPLTGKMIDPKLAQGGARLFGKDVADKQAGLQYDSQITTLRDNALKAPLDTAQHVKDIGSWYGQVLGSLKTAGERDRAITQGAVDSTVDATGAIASAIGGAANAGSGLVGAAGAQSAGTLAALGAAQDQYNADLAPILQAEAAAQKTRESAAGTSRLHDLDLQIANALGERGQAKAVNQLAIDQANNQILDNRATRQLEILGANNAARQTNFTNRYGVETTKLGAQVSGAKIAGDIVEKAMTAQEKAAAAKVKKGPKTWAATPASQKTYAYKNLTSELAGNKAAYQANPKLLFNFTRNFVNKNGWSLQNPNVMAWVRNAYREAGIQA